MDYSGFFIELNAGVNEKNGIFVIFKIT